MRKTLKTLLLAGCCLIYSAKANDILRDNDAQVFVIEGTQASQTLNGIL